IENWKRLKRLSEVVHSRVVVGLERKLNVAMSHKEHHDARRHACGIKVSVGTVAKAVEVEVPTFVIAVTNSCCLQVPPQDFVRLFGDIEDKVSLVLSYISYPL